MAGLKLLNRREFIRTGLVAGAGAALATTVLPASLFAGKKPKQLLILHTNDVHSRIDPFPMNGGRYQGRGGFSRRAALIKKYREEYDNVLLFDSGDIFQGTPYFNIFRGDLEIKLMSEMKYDASTLGNHEFDIPVEELATRIKENAGFPFVVSNYLVENTPLEGLVKKNLVLEKDGIKVGVYGLGVELDGMAIKEHYGNVTYTDPVIAMKVQENILKNEQGCDLIVCLSHLGYQYESDRISDKIIASASEHTNMILGGHTHTFLEQPDIIQNKAGENCYIMQTGFAGVNLGVIRIDFDNQKTAKKLTVGLINV